MSSKPSHNRPHPKRKATSSEAPSARASNSEPPPRDTAEEAVATGGQDDAEAEMAGSDEPRSVADAGESGATDAGESGAGNAPAGEPREGETANAEAERAEETGRPEETADTNALSTSSGGDATGDDTRGAEAAVAAKPAARIEVEVWGLTDVGQIRPHNEDNFLVTDLQTEDRIQGGARFELGARGAVLGVCDGMGGAAAGEVASQLAVDIVYDQMREGDPTDRDGFAARLVDAISSAGVRIFTEAKADRSRRGMGTTSTIAGLVDQTLFLGQVGDSRGYVFRSGKLVQVTRDQSLVTQLIESGQLTEEEAETFEHNNIILQALGTSDHVQVDLTYVNLRRGDVLLVCSDGLSGMIRGPQMRDLLAENSDLEAAARALIAKANEAGGHDNITVVLARFAGDDLAEPDSDDVNSLKYAKYTLPSLAVEEAAEERRRSEPLGRVTKTRISIAPSTEEADEASPFLLHAHAQAADAPLFPPWFVRVLITMGVALLVVGGYLALDAQPEGKPGQSTSVGR
jgi:serine/threonine protein phosphatase PrpC